MTEERSNCQRLTQEVRDSNKQILELREGFDELKRTHDEEMEEMVDLVNELKVKEDTLVRTGKQVNSQFIIMKSKAKLFFQLKLLILQSSSWKKSSKS